MDVRIANFSDKNEVLRLLVQGHAENGMFPLELGRVNQIVDRMLAPELLPPWDTGLRGAIGVIGAPEHLEGIAFLVIGTFWYTNQRHLEELIVYVDPAHRQSGHHKALIGWMKQQASSTNLHLFSGISSNKPTYKYGEHHKNGNREVLRGTDRTDAKVRLYERMMPKAGAFFCYIPVTIGSSSTLPLG